MRLTPRVKNLIGALGILVVTLGIIELGLRLIDPWGMRYFDDVTLMSRTMFVSDAQRGYGLKDGAFVYSHWQAHIEDGRRILPAANTQAACDIAFLGDSITFGHGVNDDQTWVNQVAAGLPDAQLYNYGVPRYSIPNVLGTRREFPDHKAYIYTVFNNDSEPPYDPSHDTGLISGLNQPWILLYAQYAVRRQSPAAPIDSAMFFGNLDALLAEGRVSLVAFQDDVLTSMIQERGYTVEVVPYPKHPISVVDFHLNPEGSQELAASLTPFVKGIAEEACAG